MTLQQYEDATRSLGDGFKLAIDAIKAQDMPRATMIALIKGEQETWKIAQQALDAAIAKARGW